MSRPNFTFRLERVRSLRELAERSAQENLAASLHHARAGEDALTQADASIAGAHDALRDAVVAPVSGADLVAAGAYLDRVAIARTAAAHDLVRREAEVDQRRSALGEAARERQALERLRTRRRAEHERDVARIEGAALDEMATNAFLRRSAA